jgi:hypothetical protein
VAFLLLYAAFALREDEDGAIQSRIEEWWIKITDKRSDALSISASFIREIARLTLLGIDRIFGASLMSVRFFGVSLYFSLASLNLLSLFTYQDHAFHFAKPIPLKEIVTSLRFVGAGLFPAFASFLTSSKFRWLLAFWYLGLAWGLIGFLDFAHFVYKSGHGKLAFGMIFFSGLGLLISGMFDILYVQFIRWLLQRISTASTHSQIYHGLLLASMSALLALTLFAVPIALGVILIHYAHSVTGIGIAGFVLIFSWVFNLITLLTCFLGFLLAFTILLHRLFWPLLQRPLYGFQRFGIIKKKKLLWSVGIFLLLLPKPDSLWHLWHLFLSAAEKF